MKRVVYIGFLFFTATSFGRWTDYVVKVQSGVCGQPNPFLGSGLLFSNGGQAFVVTSDHVVLHNYQSGTCHTISSEKVGVQRASFHVAEWGNGLALLEVEKLTPDPGWPTLKDLASIPSVGEKVSVIGFPADSQDVVVDSRGKISHLSTELPFFPLVPTLIEVNGAQGEFGMSGGIVANANGFAGILSHQTLEGLQNRLFVIPSSAVVSWLNEVVVTKKFSKVVFQQYMDDQLLALDTVKTREAAWDIGIIEGFHHLLEAPVIRVQRFPDLNGYKPFRDSYGRLERMCQFLLDPKTHTHVQIHYFRKGKELSRNSTLVPVTSLSDFFAKVVKSDWVPLFVTPMGMFEWEDVLLLRSLALELQEAISGISPDGNDLLQELADVAYWLSMIPDSIESLDERWTLVTVFDLESLQNGYASQWSQLKTDRPAEAKNLIRLINLISERRQNIVGL